MQMIFIASLFVLAVVPFWFILHKVYKDGVLGRIALGFIVFNSSVILMAIFVDGWTYDLSPEVILLIFSMALFLVWHLWRFERRVVQNKKAVEGAIDRRRLLT